MEGYDEFQQRKVFGGTYRDSFEYSQTPTNPHENMSLSTLLFNDMPASVSERDLRHALEDEKVRFIDLRFMRDRSRCFAFVDFAPEEAVNFIRNCRNEIKVRGFKVLFDYADPKDEAIRFERSHANDSRFSGNVEEPTSNIMVRGIPPDIDERDIIEELNRNNIRYADVRVIRDRVTGVSRGFGFIEFASTQEAIHWMDAQKGLLHVRRHVMRLNFSSPRNQSDTNRNDTSHRESRFGNSHNATSGSLASGDWRCFRCSSHNFKRREFCFRCQHPRSQVQPNTNVYTSDGSDLVGTTPCNTLILRCLDAFTTELNIQTAFNEQHNVQIKRCHVVRDSGTSSSRFAVAELPTVADAYKVVDTIMKEHKIFEIEGKAIAINYAKNNFNTLMTTLKTESILNESTLASHSQSNSTVNNVSGYSSYAPVQISVPPPPLPSSGVAVAQAAIQMKQTEARLASIVAQSVHHPQGLLGYPPQHGSSTVRPQSYLSTLSTFPAPTMPFNASTAATTEYPFPDTAKFFYDETIRYYYDPLTGLLYEPNTRYFFDRTTQQYYHYDSSRSLYVPALEVANQQNKIETTKSIEEPTKKKEKKDKEKTAQKIAKEMEKWARRMNSQKEATAAAPKVEQISESESSKTADMGYAILQAASSVSISSNLPTTPGLVAQYGGEDSEEDEVIQPDEKELEAQVTTEESKLMDWTKLACLLCSRGFKDVETMQKHRVFSNLHLQNLNKLRSKCGLKEISALPVQQQQTQKLETQTHAEAIESLMQLGAAAANNHARDVAAIRQHSNSSPPYGSISSGRYRDRARERREKFGTVPPPRFDHQEEVSLKAPSPHCAAEQPCVLAPPSPAASNGAPGGNVGSRLMEKMGWQAGQGLGKSNQGRTQLVEPEFREFGVGLGVKASKRLPPADNYKDNVKRAMYARYHELG